MISQAGRVGMRTINSHSGLFLMLNFERIRSCGGCRSEDILPSQISAKVHESTKACNFSGPTRPPLSQHGPNTRTRDVERSFPLLLRYKHLHTPTKTHIKQTGTHPYSKRSFGLRTLTHAWSASTIDASRICKYNAHSFCVSLME